MPPAARVTDMHVCPMVTRIVPHVGGPIQPPGVPTVLIDFLPAAKVTDTATCVGPTDVIVMGSAGVFINFLPAARIGDQTAHGGVIVQGSPTCIIGEVGSPIPGAAGLAGVVSGLAASGASRPIEAVVSVLAPAPTNNAPGAAARSDDPLTPDLMKDINKSPTLSKQIATLKTSGWTFKYGDGGKGTFADRSDKTIVIDPQMANDHPQLLTLMSHEVGHAIRQAPTQIPIGSLGKADYVAQNVHQNLLDEADATINNVKVKEELAQADGPNIGIAGEQSTQYKQFYDADPSTAREKIANLFADEHPSTDPNSTYRQYYGKGFSDFYDATKPGG